MRSSVNSPRLGWLIKVLVSVVLAFAGVTAAYAGAYNCGPTYTTPADYAAGRFDVIDGYNLPSGYTLYDFQGGLTSLSFDGNCTIKNFPASIGGFGTSTSQLNFNTLTGVIVFDNVDYKGKLTCTTNKDGIVIWWANGSVNNTGCEFNFSAVDGVLKGTNPTGQTTQSIGVPFTYRLTMPEMFNVTSTGYTDLGTADNTTISDVKIYDYLGATSADPTIPSLGAEATYVSNTAYLINQKGVLIPIGSLPTLPGHTSKYPKLYYPDPIPAGARLVVDITVVLDDAPTNTPGTLFTNTATWTLDRTLTAHDGTTYVANDLPGHDGSSQTMTIVAPNLALTKSGPNSSTGNLNLGQWGYYGLDIVNNGTGDAWDPTILDILPKTAQGGMCDIAPQITSTDPNTYIQVFAADGVTPVSTKLVSGTDFTLTYTGPGGSPACQMQINLLTAKSKLAPGQHLKIFYRAKLDANSIVNGAALTNVAAVNKWYPGNIFDTTPGNSPKLYQQYQLTPTTSTPCLPTDGTIGTTDCQDAHTTIVSLSGVQFEKTVENLITGTNPATTAGPGAKLRYTLRMRSLDDKQYSGVSFYDDMGALNPTAVFAPGTLANVTISGSTGTNSSNPTGGTNGAGILNVTGLTIPGGTATTPGPFVTVTFEITLASGLTDGTLVSNQASGSQGATLIHVSDDPNVNGQADPAIKTNGDLTNITIRMPQPPTKAIVPAKTQATIGEEVTYQITVPGAAYSVETLNNVVVTDVLSPALEFVSASIGGTPLTNTSATPGTVSLPIGTINAGQQVVITLKTKVANITGVGSDSTDTQKTFTNTASFTYTGGDSGPGTATSAITIVEPKLISTKTASNVTAGKASTDPAMAGDTLEYKITLSNTTGTSTAFDASIVDSLPVNETLLTTWTPTALINGTPVSAFNPMPSNVSNTLTWGRGIGDGSLDIPAGQQLVLTYRVTVGVVNGMPLDNTVNADYTSQDGAPSSERTGANCPSWTAPNDYCTTATASYPTPDPTTIVKSVDSDTWNSDGSTGTDSILRVGDTVDYRLTLTLREGQLQNVVVTDTLPAGLAFDSVVSINGDTSAPFSATAPFSYTDFTAPAISGSTVTWNLGNITNTINYNTADDNLVIVYRARVVTTLAQAATTPQTNNVKLSYTGGDPAVNTKLNSTATITVNQPIISSISKTGTVVGPAGAGNGTLATPYVVNIVNNTMNFQIQAQNTGLAPAYGVVVTDTLASQLNEQGITITSVTVGGTPATSGIDYVYTPPAARGGTMTFTLIKPLLQGATVIINYNIGFHDDVAPNQTWNNSATIGKYWSMPPGNAREYISTAPVAPSKVYMTNTFVPVAPAKVVVTPATSEAAVGDTVTYEITVPATPVNAALNNITITDALDSRLQYLSATQVSGPVVTNNSVAPTNVSFTLAQLPAGQQVKIRVNARLLNVAATQAESGGTVQNVVTYNYTGAASPLTSTPAVVTIVEPLVAITKAVTIPATPNAPNAGDELTYTVNLTASSGAQYSSAYDLILADTLGTGLTYVPGSSTVNSVAVADPSIAGQTLTWPARDIAEGAAVIVTYKAKLSDNVTAGQTLCNNASTNWTSLTGLSAYERNGSGTPAFNDYSAKAVPVCVTVSDPTNLTKAYVSDTYNDATSSVRVGDIVDYELRLTLQEGTTADVVVTDVLPVGMAYDSLVGITPASGSNFTYTVASQPAAGATTLTWNLGTVVNKGDNITTNDTLVIKYRARVLNDSALLPQSPTTKALTNNATLNYTLNGVPATPKTSSQTINALQPLLTVTKALVSTTGGDTIIDANEIIKYSVDITNSGAAPAYDTVLTDTLPLGLRQGGVTTTAITLAGAPLPVLAPTFNTTTGVATWNFDTSVANAYTIPAGQTLHLEYTVKADASLGAGLTLKNSALVPLYYSFDNNDIPSGTVNNRQVYGPTAVSSVTLTTPTPGALAKATTQPSAAIGQQFKYRITVPAAPVGIALHDVRILDDLGLSAANMRFVSASVVSGGTWTLTNTSGSSTNLVIEDTATGIDIPANGQAVIDVTVELLNTPTNDALSSTSGTFFNTASYTYNQLPNDSTTRVATIPASSGTMTITRPDLTLTKTAATPSMRVGTPNVFTLTVNNRGTGRAWDVTVTDILPNPTPGGMCSVAPTINGSVQITGGSGTRTLVYGTDYTTGFVTGATNCTYTFIGQSAAAALDPNETLVINYNAELDPDNGNSVPLTNYAGATQWFSQDTGGAGATGQTYTYTGLLTDGTPGTLDNQDKFTVLTASPTLSVTKTVFHAADNTPAPNAKPGETLHYVVTITNTSDVPLPSFSLVDDIGLLNGTAVFVSGSLANVTVTGSTADLSHNNPTGGKNGAGLLDIRNLVLGTQTDLNKTVTIAFDVTLAPVITNAVVVYNQAQVVNYGYTIAVSDDPAVTGATNPTQTIIGSNPVMQVIKTAQDLTGDPAVLMVGDTLRYTIKVKNIGTENATNVSLRDALPANTTYVANSTRLNGTIVPDVSTNVSALQAGFLIHAPAPEDTTPGFMRADASSTAANVATITFDVTINADTLNGTRISNQGFVDGSGTSGNTFPSTPSDDPSKPGLTDPTDVVVTKPSGIVYNSLSRLPIAGVQLKLLNGSTGKPVSPSCFIDPAQQGQVTTASGYYKFDLNFSAADCPPNAEYIIQVAAVPKEVVATPSIFVPPTFTGAYDVLNCLNDAITGGTPDQCEAQASATAPVLSATDTRYYMHLTLGYNSVDGTGTTTDINNQIFNNHIPLDPNFAETLVIKKMAHLVNVTRGQLVPYTITVENTLPATLTNMLITDMFPAGFKYVEGSARYAIDGSAAKPVEPLRNGLNLSWQNVTLAPNSKHTIQLLLVVSSGVSEGEYVNRAQVLNVLNPGYDSRIAFATVRVIPDPTFDCTDIIGKVFDDANRNGNQDPGEKGLPGVRLATVRGLLVTTDKYGRFHITCAITPDENRGSNFIMKVDDRTLPTGYRITTENPLVQRATRGKMMKFNFGATIHKVVRLDMSDGVFEPGTTNLRIQWKPRMDLLLSQLKKGPSVLRVGYMAEVEDEGLVNARLKAVKAEIAQLWAQQNSAYKLEIETEVFWRTGAPPERSALK